MKKYQWLYEGIIYLLALLFLYTAFSKLVDMRHFVRAIHNQPFPRSVDPILIVGVPIIEIIAGITLLRLKSRKSGLYLSAILMLAFSIYVGLAVFHFFKRVPCGCAGVFQAMSWPVHFIFNLVFLGMAITGIILQQKEKDIPGSTLKKAAA